MSIKEERVRSLVTPHLIDSVKKHGIEKARWGNVGHDQKLELRLKGLDALIALLPSMNFAFGRDKLILDKGRPDLPTPK